MQAIYTKYIPATNFKPSRIKASCERGSLTICFDSLEPMADCDKFSAAARLLCEKFIAEDAAKYGSQPWQSAWSREFVSGGLAQGGYAHVFVS